MKTDDKTLIEELLILASDIQCEDGVAVACIVKAANRLRELTRDDMVLVRKVDIAKAMLCVATSDVIEDTVWLDEFITLYEHLATIGKICDENYNDTEYLKAMIKAYEEGK